MLGKIFYKILLENYVGVALLIQIPHFFLGKEHPPYQRMFNNNFKP